MSGVLEGRNRRLLFRSYLTLAGGLLVVAVLLDFGFGLLQSREQSEQNGWLEATVRLIEARLAAIEPSQREAEVAMIATELGVGLQLLSRDEVFVNDIGEHSLAPLVDAGGNTSYLHDAESIEAVLRLGPIAAPEESMLLRLLPPLFYLSILVVVGLWLRPLLKDINVISGAAQRFAADYREPMAAAEQTTELKPLARNLDEMASRLSGVLRSQKELIAALSHEMRTPLARLRFALAVSAERAADQLKLQLADMNDDIDEIDALITSMLDYARLDHPDIEMHRQGVPVEAWLRQAVTRRLSADSIRIEVSYETLCEQAWMDPRLMELALSNLLVNTSKYADSMARCEVAEDSDSYTLIVEDDGPGIPDAEREAVFRAFTRIDDSRSRDTGGSGLGLAVVARVAELHGGRATVDSSPVLGGARFTIRWPRHSSAAARGTSATARNDTPTDYSSDSSFES